jgi:hypothetical protein
VSVNDPATAKFELRFTFGANKAVYFELVKVTKVNPMEVFDS